MAKEFDPDVFTRQNVKIPVLAAYKPLADEFANKILKVKNLPPRYDGGVEDYDRWYVSAICELAVADYLGLEPPKLEVWADKNDGGKDLWIGPEGTGISIDVKTRTDSGFMDLILDLDKDKPTTADLVVLTYTEIHLDSVFIYGWLTNNRFPVERAFKKYGDRKKQAIIHYGQSAIRDLKWMIPDLLKARS